MNAAVSSRPAAATVERDALLAQLARVGRENSDATVIFHGAVARSFDLHPTDYKTLGLLQRMGPQTAGQIAEHTGLASASVTNLLDRLEKKGFVARHRDPDDHRRVLVSAVAAQLARVGRKLESTSRSVVSMYDAYTDAELAVIADFLARNARRLRAETARLER